MEETQTGKDLIQIGEQRGLARAVLALLTTRHSDVPADLEAKIRALSIDRANRLVTYLSEWRTLDDVAQWMAGDDKV